MRNVTCLYLQSTFHYSDLHSYSPCMGGSRYEIAKKIRVIESEVLRQWHLVLQVNCPHILTNHNQTYSVCSACMDGALLECSGKSL